MLTDSPRVRARRKQMLELRRSTTRSTAASATRPANARCRTTTTSTTARRRCRATPRCARPSTSRALRPHRPRQRALHPVLALRPLHARDLEVQRARHPESRRPLARARVRGRRLRARPVFRQRDRHLPGRRAPVAAVPAQGARLVSRADAAGLPRLRARLHGPDLAPQERMEAQSPRPGAERAHRPRHAAREPGRQRSVDLQQGARPGTDLRASARPPAAAEGQARPSSTSAIDEPRGG